MSYKQSIIVGEFFNQKPVEISEKLSRELSSCRCDSGVATLTAGLEKNAYGAGEVAQVLIDLDLSKSKEHFGPISISLIHHLILQIGFKTESVSRTLKSVSIEGVKAGSNSGIKKVVFQLPQISQEDNHHKAKAYGIKKYLLKISNKNHFVNMTIKNERMNSWYEFKISCKTKQCCSTKMETSCPVHIYCPEIKAEPFTAPDNWNPTKIEQVNIAFAPQSLETKTIKLTPIENAMVSNNMIGSAENFKSARMYGQNVIACNATPNC